MDDGWVVGIGTELLAQLELKWVSSPTQPQPRPTDVAVVDGARTGCAHRQLAQQEAPLQLRPRVPAEGPGQVTTPSTTTMFMVAAPARASRAAS